MQRFSAAIQCSGVLSPGAAVSVALSNCRLKETLRETEATNRFTAYILSLQPVEGQDDLESHPFNSELELS